MKSCKRAKALCHEDGKAWDSADTEGDSKVVAISSDDDRTEYVNRAKGLLAQEGLAPFVAWNPRWKPSKST